MQNKITLLWKSIFTIAFLTFFTSASYAQLPFAPYLISPAENDSCVKLNHRFIWQQEVFSSQYILQISTNKNFTNIITAITTPNTYTDVQLSNYHYTYFWRVIVQYDNRNNNKIDTSDVWRFKTVFPNPTIISPEDGITCLESDIQFKWTMPDSTDKYKIEISDNANFSNIVKEAIVVGNNVLDWKATENNKMYYWRVRTEMHNSCASDWSETNSFKVTYKAPTLTSPANNAIGRENAVKLEWTYSINAENYVVRYSTDENISNDNVVTVPNLADKYYNIRELQLNTKYYWQVAAFVGGCKSDWSETFNFTTKYPNTTLLYPISNDQCISKTPEFKWNEVATARGYILQVSTDNTFTNDLIESRDIKDTTAIIELSKGVQKYFWRVRAYDSKNYGDWSNTESFITTYSAPTQIYPLDGTTDVEKEITFKWALPYKNLEYKFELVSERDSSGITVSSIVHSDTLTAGELSLTLPHYNAKYAWRIGVIDANNCNGMWSDYARFTSKLSAPVLVSPENEAKKVSISPDMKWELVDGAEYYEIEVATSEEFSKGTITHSMSYIHGNIIHFSLDYNYNTKYFWRVRAGKGNSKSQWSEIFNFTTLHQPAEKPMLIAPENKSTGIAINPEFIWKVSERAISYRFVLSMDSDFRNIIVDSTVTLDEEFNEENISLISPLALNYYTNYYWKVSATNIENEAVYSDIFTFRVTAKELQIAPNLISPSNDSSNLDLNVKFVWDPVPTAILYHIQIATDKDFNNIVVEDEKVNWTVRMLKVNDFGTTYYWRVRAINEIGPSPWSNIFKFTTYGKNSVENNEIVKFNIYPNPVFEYITLKYESDFEQNANIEIIDATGKVVLNKNIILASNSNNIKMNVSSFNAGNYFLTISTAKSGSNTIKFTVIK